jgi:hypothetical protein
MNPESPTKQPANQPAKAPAAGPYSPSVAGMIRRLAGKRVVPWAIVQDLLAHHPSYGRGLARELSKQPGPARGESLPVEEWVKRIETQLPPPSPSSPLHTRLVILGLSELDPALQQYLSAGGFLDALRGEVDQPGPQEPGYRADDALPLQLDNPTDDDRLGRQDFASGLALRLDRIWNEYSRSNVESSFILHVHGQWGAGKTSLLALLRGELQPRLPGDGEPEGSGRAWTAKQTASQWVVVNFNAWQHQRLDPPWWHLLDAVYRQASDQIRTRFGERWRALWIRLREALWRAVTGRRDIVTVAGILLLLGSVGYLILRLVHVAFPEELTRVKDLFGAAKDGLAVLGAVLSASVLLGRSLLSGSARAAQAFLQAGYDPMVQVKRHFRNLIGAINRPVLIVIDDLDRCQGSYVVSLLEGIQTLFHDRRVLYLIAADRRWLAAAFEKAYEPFLPTVREPGRRLGTLFLEKIFELSVHVPRLSPGQRKEYWDYLNLGDPFKAKEQLRAAREQLRKEFAEARTEAAVFQKLDDEGEERFRRQARRQLAVERLANAQVVASTSYFLQPFAPLLEPNPRAMKRLLNAYSTYRDLAILAGVRILTHLDTRKKMVLWAVVGLRWPMLEEHLLARAAGDKDKPDPEVAKLFESDEVKGVLSGKAPGVDVALDLDAIAVFTGLRDA